MPRDTSGEIHVHYSYEKKYQITSFLDVEVKREFLFLLCFPSQNFRSNKSKVVVEITPDNIRANLRK